MDIFLSKLSLLNDEKETTNTFQRQIDEKLAAEVSLKKNRPSNSRLGVRKTDLFDEFFVKSSYIVVLLLHR